MSQTTTLDLPLLHPTPAHWATGVLRNPLTLLNDHAWLEKKAASNALELLNRWPEPCPPENWVTAMTAIARDEIEHLAVVVRILARRGGRLSKGHRNPYASQLRQHVRKGAANGGIVDRLLISALIEARSCERFFLLGEHCDDTELAKLYRGLYASEEGHYRTFLGLAEQLPESTAVHERWNDLLKVEARIIARQPVEPLMHSGWAD